MLSCFFFYSPCHIKGLLSQACCRLLSARCAARRCCSGRRAAAGAEIAAGRGCVRGSNGSNGCGGPGGGGAEVRAAAGGTVAPRLGAVAVRPCGWPRAGGIAPPRCPSAALPGLRVVLLRPFADRRAVLGSVLGRPELRLLGRWVRCGAAPFLGRRAALGDGGPACFWL